MKQIQTVKFSVPSSSTVGNVDDELTVGGPGMLGAYSPSNNSFVISSSEVVVEVDQTAHTFGSSAVATRNITNYPWELVYIPGNLIAAHSSGCFIAYAVQAPNSTCGIVRIISRRTGIRGLIKNIPGLIKDLSFAYLTSRVLLAFTDHFGTLFVYEILEEEEETLGTELLIELKRSEDEERSDFQRVIWCPFIPDESADDESEDTDEENFAYLLVVTNGPFAEIFHIMTLMRSHGGGFIDRAKIEPGSGHQVMEKHSAPISDAAFSPDGTALATASLDGYVKFFQVILGSSCTNSPRCLHQWKPHDGKPLSCLFFLDNHKNPTPDVQFWKYAVTGACNNTEIKTWSCETWQCNQTISFEASPDSKLDAGKLSLKAAIDPSSRHFILSDIYRRVLYVLVVSQESACVGSTLNGDAVETPLSGKVGAALIVSISELPVQYPAIFLAITEAEWKPYKRWKHEHPGDDCFQGNKDEAEEDCDNNDIVEGLVLKCILINTKSLQDATIRFQPALPDLTFYGPLRDVSNHNTSLSDESVILKDGLTDLSINLNSTLAELDNSKNSCLMADNIETTLDGLVSFPSKAAPKASLEADNSHSKAQPASLPGSMPSSLPSPLPSSMIPSLPCVLTEAQTIPILSSSSITHSADGVTSNQPVTMNLLTPESFSSPGRTTDEDLLMKKETDLCRTSETSREKFSKTTSSPSEDLKSAALSLMLRVNSGSRLPPTDGISSGPSIATLSNNCDDSTNFENVVAGSSKSPSISTLPSIPATGPSSLTIDREADDAPLATSEVARNTPANKSFMKASRNTSYSTTSSTIPYGGSGGGVGLSSSTSSPSLEVQQILHSQNTKNGEDFDDEVVIEDNDRLEMIPSENRASLSKAAESLIDFPKMTQSPSLTSISIYSTPSQSSSMPLPTCPSSSLLPMPSSSALSSSPAGGLTISMNGVSSQAETARANSLQELINLTAGSKVDAEKNANQSPLIDMFNGIKTFTSSGTSHLIDSEHQRTSLCEGSANNFGKLKDSPSLVFSSKDSSDTLPLFKSIGAVKNHVTCEELEAEIKCTSPSAKRIFKNNDLPPISSSVGSLSTFVFPMNIADSSSGALTISSRNNPPPLSAGSLALAHTDIRYEKALEEVSSLRQLIISSHEEHEENLKALLAICRTLANQVDKNAKNTHHINKAIEDIRKSQNKLQDSLAHVISTSVKPILEGSMRQEVKNSLTPALNKCMEPIRSHINSEIQTLVSNSETHLVDSLSKTACSRQVIEAVSGSIATALSPCVQSACRDAYNKVVVPGFNAITQQVFSQLNEAFTRGTKEYLQHVETESQATRNVLLENLSAGSRTLEATNTNLSSNATVLMDALHKGIAQQTTLSETLGERLRHFVHDEIARALQEHHAAVEARTSRAQTPAAPAGVHGTSNPKIARQQVQQLLSQEQFNLAFKQVLSASDLSLVVFVCERINPQQLFSQTPCPLSQDVLLSLVNQLSHELNTFTDLKTKYLEEAVMNLDTNHPVTREHMRQVLQELQRSLSAYLEHNPNHKKLKMLLLAVNHLVAASVVV